MATYYYSLILKPDKVPSVEKRVGADVADNTAALAWIASNDGDYSPTTTYVFLRRIYDTEAVDRGFASHDGLGASTDAAATAGSTGSLNAKLRLLTTLIDTIKTDIAAIKTSESSFTSFAQGTLTAPANTPTELKVGGSILTGRRGVWISNLDSNPIFIGPIGVTTSGANRGREIGANEQQFEPIGSVSRYITSGFGLNVHIEEVA